MESPKIPSNVIGNQVDPENRAAAATNELLQILCSEIVLDGGASFVTSLKEYLSVTMSSKRPSTEVPSGRRKVALFPRTSTTVHGSESGAAARAALTL